MPELPEVETIRRGLEKCILNKKIVQIKVYEKKSFQGDSSKAVGSIIKSLYRRGKALIIELDNGYSFLVHLRMTGQLIYRDSVFYKEGNKLYGREKMSFEVLNEHSFGGGHPSESFLDELPNKQTRVVIEFDDGRLFFNDQRKFGFIKVLETKQIDDDSFIRKLAEEPWEIKLDQFYERLQKHKKSTIKAVILDQSVIAGLGNIYADESLFYASILPTRRAGDISRKEADKLVEGARVVMERSLEAGGSTIRNYVKSDGTRGDYLDKFAQVFNREGKKCLRCGRIIKKTKVGGRGTHYCDGCQK